MPIVAGIDAFRDAMVGFEDKYVLISGGACRLLFEVICGISSEASGI